MILTAVGDRTIKAWGEHPRYISSCGGTRSGKTYANLQVLSLVCWLESEKHCQPTVNSVVSESIPHLKRGAIRDFKDIMSNEGYWNEDSWNKTDSIYTFPNGSIMEFFGADSPAKVHGPARDRLLLNEAQNINKEIARQLFVRTKGIIICDYNPTHSFWLNEDIEPKDNCITIRSTYKDNKYLTAEQIAEIEDNKTDKNWWRIYGLGLVGQLEGLIYDFEQIDELPQEGKEFYGMDFGFTNDPTAIVHVKADTGRKILYLDEVCYRTRMLNKDIIETLRQNEVPRDVPIYADCAEPKSIAEIHGAGFNVLPCDKNAPTKSDKLKFQIQYVQGWKMMVTKRSLNLIKELRNYTWAKDKDGNQLNEPIDNWNHILDAARYGIYTHLAQRAGYGQYAVR